MATTSSAGTTRTTTLESIVGDRLDALRRHRTATEERLMRRRRLVGTDAERQAIDAELAKLRGDADECDYLFRVMPLISEWCTTRDEMAAASATMDVASPSTSAELGGDVATSPPCAHSSDADAADDTVLCAIPLRAPARNIVKRRGKTVGSATIKTNAVLPVVFKRRRTQHDGVIIRRLLEVGGGSKPAERTALSNAAVTALQLAPPSDTTPVVVAAANIATPTPEAYAAITVGGQHCPGCNAPPSALVVDLNGASLVCTACATSTPYLDSSSGIGVSYEQRVETARQQHHHSSNYAYKPIKHFTDWLDKSQGKEPAVVLPPVEAAVRKRLREDRITDPRLIDAHRVKLILKQLGLSSQYVHAVQIAARISGVPPLRFTPEQEAYLCARFVDIYRAWLETKPPTRQNFFSYAYVFHKLIQLCGYPKAFLKHFPLLKSRDKLYWQDQMWKRVCARLKWRFIPSDE